MVPGKGRLAMSRFYGPNKSLFEKTWKLPDIADFPPTADLGLPWHLPECSDHLA
jgi:hypothetical protein